MAELKVTVERIEAVEPHTNADALEKAILKGWQSVVKKGELKAGELCVYFPLDSVLPIELSDEMGVTNYLPGGRVCPIKLRGEPSYGLLYPVSKAVLHHNPDLFVLGVDLTDYFGVTKFVHEENYTEPGMIANNPMFLKYVDIQDIRNHPDVFQEGEEVVITEKIHGRNSRYGNINGEIHVGSFEVEFEELFEYVLEEEKSYVVNLYRRQLSSKLKTYLEQNPDTIIYGETFGYDEVQESFIQDLHYDLKTSNMRIFDIRKKGLFLNWEEFKATVAEIGISSVPVIYEGKFYAGLLKELEAKHKYSTLSNNTIMEGLVIKPKVEQVVPGIGRKILKYVFDQYLCRKKGTELK